MKRMEYFYSILVISLTIVSSIVAFDQNSIKIGDTPFTYPTAKWSIGSYINAKNVSLEFQLQITSPTKPGQYPVVFFLSGFDGLCPSIFYEDFSTRFVVTTNAILITLDKFSVLHLPNKEEDIFELTLNWAIDNINNLFNAKETPDFIKNKVFPDTGKRGYTLMSHSSAAHPVCLYLYKHCGSIKKLILMDPVDGFDPFGVIKIFVTNPPNPLPFKIPTLIISTGFDPVPVSQNVVACAPTNISNTRFYECLAGPTFYLNFTNYGHADVLDDYARKYLADLLCKSCDHTNATCYFDTYRQSLANTIHYFMDAVDAANTTFLNALENPEKSGLYDPNINVISTYKLNGYDVTKTGPFCIHN